MLLMVRLFFSKKINGFGIGLIFLGSVACGPTESARILDPDVGRAVVESEPEEDDISNQIASLDNAGISLSQERFCSQGLFGMLVQPRNAAGEVIIGSIAQRGCSAQNTFIEVGSQYSLDLSCDVFDVSCRRPGKRAVLVLIDDSGSMAGTDPDALRASACKEFVSAMQGDFQVALADFGHGGNRIPTGYEKTTELRLIHDFSTDRETLRAACDTVIPGADTPLFTSTSEGISKILQPFMERQGGGYEPSIVLLSDGQPTDSNKAEVLAFARSLNVTIYTVGLGPAALEGEGSSPEAVKVLEEIAFETAAGYISATTASDLTKAFRKVADVLNFGGCFVKSKVGLPTDSPLLAGDLISGVVQLGVVATPYQLPVRAYDGKTPHCKEPK